MFDTLRCGGLPDMIAALVTLVGQRAFALTSRLGKAVPIRLPGATEVGIEPSFGDKACIEVEVTSFRGDAQMRKRSPPQASKAGSVGAGLGFRFAKGAPATELPPCTGRRPSQAGAPSRHAGEDSRRSQGKRIGQ